MKAKQLFQIKYDGKKYPAELAQSIDNSWWLRLPRFTKYGLEQGKWSEVNTNQLVFSPGNNEIIGYFNCHFKKVSNDKHSKYRLPSKRISGCWQY